MKIPKSLVLAAPLALSLAGQASADVWDVQIDSDDGTYTDNELLHGTTQTHDLGARPGLAADQDWFLMPQRPHTSYEVLLDGMTGDIAGDLALDRIAANGVGVAQTHAPAVVDGFGFSRALRWINTDASTAREFVRV